MHHYCKTHPDKQIAQRRVRRNNKALPRGTSFRCGVTWPMCCNGSEARDVDAAINKQLIQEQRERDREVKLLLLGPGDSGKSTVAKQMKIIHLHGFTEQELLHYRPVVFANTLQSLKSLIYACQKFSYELSPAAHVGQLDLSQEIGENLVKLNPVTVDFTPALGEDIKLVWREESVQKAFQRQSEFQLPGVAA